MKPTKNILSTRLFKHKPADSDGLHWEDFSFITTELLPFDQQTCVEWMQQEGKKPVAIFTSANSLESLVAQGFPMATIKSVCCISGATKKTIKNHLPVAEILAEGKNARLLLQNMSVLFADHRFLFFCGASRMDTIPERLSQEGSEMKEVHVYETQEYSLKTKKEWDAVLFFSPSAVRSYLKKNRLRAHTVAVSIGESTTKALKPFSSKIVEAPFPSEESMIEATIKALK